MVFVVKQDPFTIKLFKTLRYTFAEPLALDSFAGTIVQIYIVYVITTISWIQIHIYVKNGPAVWTVGNAKEMDIHIDLHENSRKQQNFVFFAVYFEVRLQHASRSRHSVFAFQILYTLFLTNYLIKYWCIKFCVILCLWSN